MQQTEAAPDQVGGDLAADAQDRRVGGVSGGERRRGVEQPRPRHHGIGADLAARPRIAVGHVGRALLVPGMDHPERLAGVVERDEQRVVLHAGEGKDRVHPVPAQHLDQRLAARHPRHPTSSKYPHPPSPRLAPLPRCGKGATMGPVRVKSFSRTAGEGGERSETVRVFAHYCSKA